MTDPTAIAPFAESLPVACWLLLCGALAVAACPLAIRLFRGLPDRGLGLAPILGVAIAAVAFWWMGQDWSADGGFRSRLLLLAFALAAFGLRALLLPGRWGFRGDYHANPVTMMLPFIALVLLALLPIPFTLFGVWIVLIGLAGFSIASWWGDFRRLRHEARRALAPGVCSLALFVLGFVLVVAFRSQLPGAYMTPGYYGAEKGGNLMHLASAMRSTWFPVSDAWFLGEPVNYYNGGHIAAAMLAKGAGVSVGHAFNLGLATLFGLILSTAFSLCYNIVHRPGSSPWRSLSWSVLGAGAVGAFGNLDALHQVLSRPSGSDQFDFWRTSRTYSSNYLPGQDAGTITEFPAFSLLLGDLHAHHMALPMGMLLAAIIVSLWRKSHRLMNTPDQWWSRCVVDVVLLGIAMAAAFVVNAWDAVVYAPIVLLAVVFSWSCVKRATALSRQIVWPALSLILFCVLSLCFSAFVPLAHWAPLVTIMALVIAIVVAWWILQSASAPFADRILGGLLAYAVIGIIALLFALPHLLTFQSPFQTAEKLLATTFPPRINAEIFHFPDLVVDSVMQRTPLRIVPVPLRTSLWEYLTMWGLFVLPITGMMVTRFLLIGKEWPTDKIWAFLLGSLALFCISWNAMGAMAGALTLTLAILSFILAWRRNKNAESILWVLLGTCFLWHTFVEVFYFNDAYEGHRVRYNTPFKILYPTWPILAIAMTYALRRTFVIARSTSLRGRGVQLLFVVLIARVGLITPMEGTAARLRETHPAEGTIDSLAWMGAESATADDLAVIRWINANVIGHPLLLEAPPRADSASYTSVGRIAAATGLPTLIGWLHHQAQWRGWTSLAPAHLLPLLQAEPASPVTHYALFTDLSNQADMIYRSTQLNEQVTQAIDRLGLELIFVGSLERERYSEVPGSLEKFETFPILFQSGDAALYALSAEDHP